MSWGKRKAYPIITERKKKLEYIITLPRTDCGSVDFSVFHPKFLFPAKLHVRTVG